MSVARIQQPNLTSRELLEALSEQWHLKAPDENSRDPQAELRRFVDALESGELQV